MGTWFHVEKQLLVISFLIKFIPHCFWLSGNLNDLKGMASSPAQYPLNILVAEYHFASQSKESLFTSAIPSICAPAALTPNVYPEVFLPVASITTETP